MLWIVQSGWQYSNRTMKQRYYQLIRLLLAVGRVDAARRQYRKLRRDRHRTVGEALPASLRQQVRGWFAEAQQAVSVRPVTQTSIIVATPTVVPRLLLPPRSTRFFGRDAEISRLEEILAPNAAHRLVTLTGPAGSGKSRLAVEVAARFPERLPCFVPLADIGEVSLLGLAVVGALRLTHDPKTPPFEQIAAALNAQAQAPLLILDNLEHLLEQAGLSAAVTALLDLVPRLSILATSRQPLQIASEEILFVASLATPPREEETTPGALQGNYACIHLLVDWMQAVRLGFHNTSRSAPAVADLCRRLDGLPLALETVATWARTLTPAEMLAQLSLSERRPAILSSRRPRGAVPDLSETQRHSSLQAAIDWSYYPLAPELKRFFRRLHVFRGGCTDVAAAFVCEEPHAAEMLAALRERSLVVHTEVENGEPRFRLLETLREFGKEQSDPAERDLVVRRHAEYYRGLAEHVAPELLRPDQAEWGARLRVEADNFRAALDTALTPSGDALLGLRLAGTLWRFWTVFAHFSEGRQYLQRLLDCVPASDSPIPGRIRALFSLSNVSFYLGDAAEGLARAQECLAAPRLPEDEAVAAMNQAWLGVMLFFFGDLAMARANLKLGLAAARRANDEWVIGYALAQTSLLAFFAEDYGEALALSSESIEITERLGETWLVGLNSLVLSLCAQHHDRDNERANEFFNSCLAAWEPLNDVWCLAFCKTMFGFVLQRSGLTEQAEGRHRVALLSFQAMGAVQGIATALGGLGEAAAARGDVERAIILMGASASIHEQIDAPPWTFLLAYRYQVLADARETLGLPLFSAAWDTGRSLSVDQAIARALSYNYFRFCPETPIFSDVFLRPYCL